MEAARRAPEPESAPATAVDLRDVVAVAGRFPLLTGVTVEVAAGDVLFVRGANGAGKTSLLRVCAGLLAATSGEVVVLGVDLRRGRTRPEGTAYVGHRSGCYDALTVEENVRLHARSGRRRADDVERAIEAMAMGALRGVRHGRLSAGQRQRCALAVAAVRRPRLLLLDEPYAALDDAGTALVDGLIASASASGAAVLFTSHDVSRARAVAHEELVLAGGASR